jgi:hypothetical protein
MRLMRPDPAAALLGLRAMKTIATASGEIGPAQRGLMQAAQKVILGIEADSTPCRRSRLPSWPRAFPMASSGISSSTACW